MHVFVCVFHVFCSLGSTVAVSFGQHPPDDIGSWHVNTDFHKYSILVGNELWLDSAEPFITANGKRYMASTNMTVVKTGKTSGMDSLGKFSETWFRLKLKGSLEESDEVKLLFRKYTDHPLVLFGQVTRQAILELSAISGLFFCLFKVQIFLRD